MPNNYSEKLNQEKKMKLSEKPMISSKGYMSVKESRILDIPIANLNYREIVSQIVRWAKNYEHRYVGVCNVHSTTSAAWDPQLKKALQLSDLNTADGMPLVWMQKILGFKRASRVYGPTLMLHTLEAAEKSGLRVAFYGGHPDRLPVMINKLSKNYPDLHIVESISPPFRNLTAKEDTDYTNRLILARADIIWVGLGCPKQESWMLKHRGKIPGVMVGVGAAFDFHAGAVRQASSKLQNMGLEWAFRLYCEPRRLMGRYLSTNPAFVFRAGIQLFKKLFLHRNYIDQKNINPTPQV